MTAQRRLLLAAGAAAAGAGLASAWWLRRAQAPRADDLQLWQHEWPTPGGATLAMASLRGRPLVLNFWATWCPPCIKEMPQLDRFHASQQGGGWQVVGLAVDQPGAVQAFLRSTPVAYPIAIVGMGGLPLARSLGSPAGALPFTVLLDASGRVRRQHSGETDFDQLTAWTRAI